MNHGGPRCPPDPLLMGAANFRGDTVTRFKQFCVRAWGGIVWLFRRDFKLGRPSLGRVFSWFAVLGLMFMSCIVGAAVMYFELPGSGVLQKAFVGAKALHERGASGVSAMPAGTKPGVVTDRADKTCDGFTLITTNSACHAQLVDMRGNVVHNWNLPFSKAWPVAEHVTKALPDERIHWFRGHLFPNGDLLAVYQTEADTPCGYGLAKMDKDSKLLWTYSGRVHHNVDVGEDGTIYTLTGQNMRKAPAGLEYIPTPFTADFLVMLSPEGKELEKLNILEAFRDSPFAFTLAVIEDFAKAKAAEPAPPIPPGPEPKIAPIGDPKDGPPLNGMKPARIRQPPFGIRMHVTGDVVHANSIRVLNPSMAAKFPMFKSKQVLISLRSLDTIAMVDLQARKVTWAAQGMWSGQHDPEFLDNGRMLIYDNYGAAKGTRVLEFDPQTGAVPWWYANEDSPRFVARSRGHAQRLTNGNTLIVDPEGGRLLEVTGSKELAWELGYTVGGRDLGRSVVITGAYRYPAGQLTFLKGDVRARP